MALIYLCIYVDTKYMYRYFQHFQKASCKFDIYIQLTLPKKAQVNRTYMYMYLTSLSLQTSIFSHRLTLFPPVFHL